MRSYGHKSANTKRITYVLISKKRSDLYFTITEDERKALTTLQKIDRKIALKKPKR
jgi:hypothetical protein